MGWVWVFSSGPVAVSLSWWVVFFWDAPSFPSDSLALRGVDTLMKEKGRDRYPTVEVAFALQLTLDQG